MAYYIRLSKHNTLVYHRDFHDTREEVALGRFIQEAGQETETNRV